MTEQNAGRVARWRRSAQLALLRFTERWGNRVAGWRRTSRLARLGFTDRAGPLAAPVAIAVLTVAIGTFEWRTGIATSESIATLTAGGLASIAAAYVVGRLQRTNARLSEITLSYIATGDRGLLDELLGRLITGRFRQGNFKPSDQLFQTLAKVAHGNDWELKRRTVEAVPGLAELDVDRSIALLEILRDDWDGEKWRGDIRRRAVEALIARGPATGRQLASRMSDVSVNGLLALRDDDQVWTALAVIEVSEWLAARQRTDEPEKAASTSRVLREGIARLRCTDDERKALQHHRDAVAMLNEGDLPGCLTASEQLAKSPNTLERTSAARLVGSVSGHPEAGLHSARILETMVSLSADGERYVRRPLAREVSVRFLLSQSNGAHADIARDLLINGLLRDPDDIIPLTTFDLLASNEPAKNLLETAISVVRARGTPDDLLDRATRAEQTLGSQEP